MALGALRNLAVDGMAHGAVDLTVLTLCVLPFRIDCVMAGAACLSRGVRGQGYLQGFVDLVARCADIHSLAGQMRLMAIQTVRNKTVLGMAGITALLRVRTGEFIELFRRTAVAYTAIRCQLLIHRHLTRRMGIDMAGQTIGELISMRRFMALAALRHQLFPVPLPRVEGVKYLVAIPTIESMAATLVLQPAELCDMALPALGHGQRLRGNRIQISARCSLAVFSRSGLTLPGQAAAC